MYTYLAATFPVCFLGQSPPYSKEHFLFQCAGVLLPDELKEVQDILFNRLPQCRTAFGRAWAALNFQMDEEIGVLRARKWEITPPPATMYSGFSMEVAHMVHEAFNLETPREMEWRLDQGRWNLAQDLIPPERPLGFERILAFAVELRLMHRWAAMDADTGQECLDSLLEGLVNDMLG